MKRPNKNTDAIFESITECIKTPVGMANITIRLKQKTNIVNSIDIKIGYNGSTVCQRGFELKELINLCLEAGVSVERIVNKIGGSRETNPVYYEGFLVYSLGDAVARVLARISGLKYDW